MRLIKPIETDEERKEITETFKDKSVLWRAIGVGVLLIYFFAPYTNKARLALGISLTSGIVIGTSLAFYQRYIWQRGLTIIKRLEWIPLSLLVIAMISIFYISYSHRSFGVLIAILIGLYSSVLTAPMTRELWFFLWRNKLPKTLQEKGVLPPPNAASTRAPSS